MHFRTLSTGAAAVALAAAHTVNAAPLTDGHAIVLDDIITTASPLARSQAELNSATGVLGGRELVLARQPSLGETLANEPGMSSTWFGPGSSRPLIRGLGGDRVRILQNGTDTLDASTTSPDHAVSLEPFLVKRIEVVRGPASLLYGGSAVGGVVNVIDHRIESEVPERPVSGLVDLGYETGSEGLSYGAMTDIALARSKDQGVVLHLDGFRRSSDDIRIPGFADPSNPVNEGRLTNSAISSDGGSAGLSYVGGAFEAGFNYNGYNTRYGVVAEPDVQVDLRQRRLDFAAEVHEDFGIFTGARAKAGFANYRHAELEDGATGTVFSNRGFDARAELLHAPLAGLTGAWGVQARRSDFDVVGDEAFLPPSVTRQLAAFVFEELPTGPLTWQAGARLEGQNIDTRSNAVFTSASSRDDLALGLSGGVVWKVAQGYALAGSVTRTERAPNAQELFADGPHIGTDAYEIGDPDLDIETSVGAELGLRKLEGFVTGSFSLYANRFDGYIYEQDTGLFEPVDGLPIYRFVQQDALFYGAELETVWHLHNDGRHALDLKLDGDVTFGEEVDGGDLPRIPPFKGVVGLLWASGSWSAGVDTTFVARQTRTAAGETETPAWALLGASVGYGFTSGPIAWDVFLRGTNLTDQEARVHTSFLKEIAPLPGRSLTLGLRASF